MYLHHLQDLPPSPSSSVDVTPSSSPVFGPVDSSPPSSPSLVPYALDSPRATPFSHPFAASTKAIKQLPDYEKKTDSLACTPPSTFTRAVATLSRAVLASRSLQEQDYISPISPGASPPLHRTSLYIDREQRIWEDALRRPVDTGIGQIDLSNQNLKSIPPSIGDLAGFFNTPEVSEQGLVAKRMLTRVRTEPPVADARARSFERTQSIKDSGKERHVLKLYLMCNAITSLPSQLFSVTNLTVLSLRKNKLTFIPPDIHRLINLTELNISNNELTFLPWQMLEMKIEKLLVHPNPFLPEPPSLRTPGPPSRTFLRSRRSLTRLHSLRKEAQAQLSTTPRRSPVSYSLAHVPPLTELCLRLLLAPSNSTANANTHPPHTVIAEYYGVPLSDQWTERLPPSVRCVLTEVVPGVLRPRKRFSIDTIAPEDVGVSVGAGTGTCPNPVHKGKLFVRHASERFSWERRIAGVDVGGVVPLRWRGCLRTCLDFLDKDVREEEQTREETKANGRRVDTGTLAPALAADESESDMDMAVQAVDLAGATLDVDDFDD